MAQRMAERPPIHGIEPSKTTDDVAEGLILVHLGLLELDRRHMEHFAPQREHQQTDAPAIDLLAMFPQEGAECLVRLTRALHDPLEIGLRVSHEPALDRAILVVLSEFGDPLPDIVARWNHAQSVDFGRRPQILGLERPSQIRIAPALDLGDLESEPEINVAGNIELVDQDVTWMNVIVDIPGVLIDDAALEQMNENLLHVGRTPFRVSHVIVHRLTAVRHDQHIELRRWIFGHHGTVLRDGTRQLRRLALVRGQRKIEIGERQTHESLADAEFVVGILDRDLADGREPMDLLEDRPIRAARRGNKRTPIYSMSGHYWFHSLDGSAVFGPPNSRRQ